MGRGRGSEVQCRGEGAFTASAVPCGSCWGAIPPSAKHQHTHPGAALWPSRNCSGVAAAQLSSRSLSPAAPGRLPMCLPATPPPLSATDRSSILGPTGQPEGLGKCQAAL